MMVTSRDTSFKYLVLKETLGRGVDIVLNYSTRETLQACIHCLAKDGKFIQIDRFDRSIIRDSLHLGLLRRNFSFHNIAINRLFSDSLSTCIIIRLLKEAVCKGSIKPLPRKCFTENDLETALKFSCSSKHLGKVLINVRQEKSILSARLPKAVPR